jgi:AraC-like DNA-binding protein
MDSEFISALFFSVFITVSFMSACVCLHHYFALGPGRPRRHVLIIILTYVATLCCWLEVIAIMMNLPIAVYMNTLFAWICMMNVVLLYHFFYIVTGVGRPTRFSPLHYIVPAVLAAGLTVWSVSKPYEERADVLFFDGHIFDQELSTFSIVYILMPLSYTIYGIFYAGITYFRLLRYRKVVINYSADARCTSVGWVTYFLVFLLATCIAPVFSVLAVNLGIPLWMEVFLIPIPFGLMFLAYNVVIDNYVIISPLQRNDTDENLLRSSRIIVRSRFEQYMEKQKPYLNPGLCITDLLSDLCTNRTYLSNFINREYHMSFNALMNNYRLREIDRLRLDPGQKKQNSLELIKKAGFSSYRSYITAGKQQYRRNLILSGI